MDFAAKEEVLFLRCLLLKKNQFSSYLIADALFLNRF